MIIFVTPYTGLIRKLCEFADSHNPVNVEKTMSQSCPLCGKAKPEDALFCDDCAKKIHSEFEVEISGETGEGGETPVKDISSTKGKTHSEEESRPIGKTNEKEVSSTKDKSSERYGASMTGAASFPKRKKRVGTPMLFILLIALLVGAFFVYNATTRKKNLERSSWEAAVKANSTEGYLAYMETHPQGAHFDEAQTGLLTLKSEEASAWERMKETDNVSELRDFLGQHSASPYVPLVKSRLDSLIWIGSLRTNTAESYSDYMMLMENGEINGDYIAEARKRFDLLGRSDSADAVVLDSIRTSIDGFFLALSSLNHDGMFRYLAPTVNRFFDSGTATRERITGELLVTGAQTESGTLKFIPDLESVRYEVTENNHYKVNVPLQKSYPKDGAIAQVHGYIVHLELDPFFQIVSVFETKPYPEAP